MVQNRDLEIGLEVGACHVDGVCGWDGSGGAMQQVRVAFVYRSTAAEAGAGER